MPPCIQHGCTEKATPARGLCARCNNQHTLNQVLDEEIAFPAWDAALSAALREGASRRTSVERARRATARALALEGRKVLAYGDPSSLRARAPWILGEHPNCPRWRYLTSIIPAKTRGKLTLRCRSLAHPSGLPREYAHRVSEMPTHGYVEYCPECGLKGGYRTNRPGYLYLLRRHHPELGLVHKFGISNAPQNRLARHKANYSWELKELWFHKDGAHAYALEGLLKSALRVRGERGLVGEADRRGYRLDGYTECWMRDTWPRPLGSLTGALNAALRQPGVDPTMARAAMKARPLMSRAKSRPAEGKPLSAL